MPPKNLGVGWWFGADGKSLAKARRREGITEGWQSMATKRPEKVCISLWRRTACCRPERISELARQFVRRGAQISADGRPSNGRHLFFIFHLPFLPSADIGEICGQKKWKVRTSASKCSGAPLPDRLGVGGARIVLAAGDLRSRASQRLPGEGLLPKHRPIDNERSARTEHLSIV